MRFIFCYTHPPHESLNISGCHYTTLIWREEDRERGEKEIRREMEVKHYLMSEGAWVGEVGGQGGGERGDVS